LAEKQEERNLLVELYDDLQKEQHKHQKLKVALERAIIGQGSITFFNSQTLKKNADGNIVEDGPTIEMYSINSRPTLEGTVKRFYQETDEGKQIEPFVQKHLVTIITTKNVVDSSKLGKYGSTDFPLLEFTGEEGHYALGNGHHCYQLTQMVYKGMIDRYEKALNIVSQGGTKAANSQRTKDVRADLETSALYLYKNACWGVLLYDEGNVTM
jgi:hypothetical protein